MNLLNKSQIPVHVIGISDINSIKSFFTFTSIENRFLHNSHPCCGMKYIGIALKGRPLKTFRLFSSGIYAWLCTLNITAIIIFRKPLQFIFHYSTYKLNVSIPMSQNFCIFINFNIWIYIFVNILKGDGGFYVIISGESILQS